MCVLPYFFSGCYLCSIFWNHSNRKKVKLFRREGPGSVSSLALSLSGHLAGTERQKTNTGKERATTGKISNGTPLLLVLNPNLMDSPDRPSTPLRSKVWCLPGGLDWIGRPWCVEIIFTPGPFKYVWFPLYKIGKPLPKKAKDKTSVGSTRNSVILPHLVARDWKVRQVFQSQREYVRSAKSHISLATIPVNEYIEGPVVKNNLPTPLWVKLLWTSYSLHPLRAQKGGGDSISTLSSTFSLHPHNFPRKFLRTLGKPGTSIVPFVVEANPKLHYPVDIVPPLV